MSMKQAIC